MDIYTLDHTGMISYEILSKYHFSAESILKMCKERNEPFEVNFKHEVNIAANDHDEAKQKFVDYLIRLKDLGVFYHAAHIAYLIKNMVEFEGNFIEQDSQLHKQLKFKIEQLIQIIKLRDNPNSINMEFTHKSYGKDFEDYLALSDPIVVSASLNSAGHALLNKIKQDVNSIPFELIDEVKNLSDLDIDKLSELNDKLISIKDKVFTSEFIYTVCKTIRNYLNEESNITHPTAFLTNDQARVIYEACSVYGILNVSHDMDYEKINYIKAVLNNGKKKDGIKVYLKGS